MKSTKPTHTPGLSAGEYRRTCKTCSHIKAQCVCGKSAPTHTPGPWVLGGRAMMYSGRVTIYGARVPNVCPNLTAPPPDLIALVEVNNNPSWSANQRLIAAAPELLEAAVRFLENMEENDRIKGSPEAQTLRAAIAKAEWR